ncbi:hypothetical protein DSECCO2_401470 [anaerobic digester metagenome]
MLNAMKICPKCRYLDHEENGPNYECPMCGVIYSRVIDKINEEKIKYNEQQFEKKWNKFKKAPEKAFSTFWIWAGIMAVVAVISGINIQNNARHTDIVNTKPNNNPQRTLKDTFQTKFEMRTKGTAECPFKVISNDAPHTVFILLDARTKEKIALLYVKRNDELEIKVPSGTYSYQMIQGENWLGDHEHFGLSTAYLEGDKTFTFDKTAKGTEGHVIKLKAVNGNMHPRPTERISLQ